VQPSQFQIVRQIPGAGSVTLDGEEIGSGPPLVLLHGLSATRRNVVQGSRALPRGGYRTIAYDARGHGTSSPAPTKADYEYADLVADLELVLDRFELERPAVVGSSMGAATAMAFALEHPERVAALVQITPAYAGEARTGALDGDTWRRMADELERGGVDAFVDAAEPDGIPERWREIAREATRQRMERHEHPQAVADALRVVPRSLAWRGMDPLERLEVPTLVVGSRDEADKLHPLAVAEEYARRLPNVELVVEDEGQSPVAWQGARLSGAIADFLARNGYRP
jgi:pimeloyl-ACP methyl ester carboxylesterase